MLTCALLCPPFFSPFPYHVVTPLFYACVCNPLSIGSQPFFFTWHVGCSALASVCARIGWVWAREATRPAREAAPHNLSTVLSGTPVAIAQAGSLVAPVVVVVVSCVCCSCSKMLPACSQYSVALQCRLLSGFICCSFYMLAHPKSSFFCARFCIHHRHPFFVANRQSWHAGDGEMVQRASLFLLLFCS